MSNHQNTRFAVDHWAAWAPTLVEKAAWMTWFDAPYLVPLEGSPELAQVPPMARRRIERLGKMAMQVAYLGLDDTSNCPVVFASRYGEIKRSIELIGQLIDQQPMSPTAFGMSVHNAIAAQFSIARGDTAPYTAIAAGAETTEAAFIEAVGLLAEGEREVLVVYYDEPLPELFASFGDEDNFPRAWACRLVHAETGGVSLTPESECGAINQTELAPDLAALRFLLSTENCYRNTVGSRTWRWQRHV
jgi:hypothetical protein